MDSVVSYEYQPLVESDAIRLLELQPSRDLDAQVECSLISTTLSACDEDLVQHYTALSYVWGDANVEKKILVEGNAFSITTNLDTALRNMRDAKRKRFVWADAICINQSDVTEKNQQVTQMGKIYQDARHTIIFLGESTPDSHLVMEALRGKRSLDEYSASLPWASVFSRPWFTRVWVFQELVLSRDPWVQCGRISVRWHGCSRQLWPSRVLHISTAL